MMIVAFAPPLHGYGNEVGRSDPVFMAKLGLEPVTNHRPSFPYEYKKLDVLLQQGDPHQAQEAKVGMGWVAEVCSGHYRSWDALRFLRDNWKGPIVLKGILKASVSLYINDGARGLMMCRMRKRRWNMELMGSLCRITVRASKRVYLRVISQ